MATERLQRRIEQLLDEAEEAVSVRWTKSYAQGEVWKQLRSNGTSPFTIRPKGFTIQTPEAPMPITSPAV